MGEKLRGNFIKHHYPKLNNRYEDMCANLELAIRRVGKFIGGRAAQLVDDSTELRRIVAESRIDSMRENQIRWFPELML